MDTMNLRQRIAAMLPCFALAAFLFSPLYTLALFAVYKHLDAKNRCKMRLFYAVLLVLVIDLLVICFGGKNVILHAAPSNILEWFFVPSPLRLCVPLVVALLYVCCGNAQARIQNFCRPPNAHGSTTTYTRRQLILRTGCIHL